MSSDGFKAGSVVVSYITSPLATWVCLVMLISIHLATNHAAVTAVSMRSLNRQRANILFSNYFDGKGTLTPEAVSRHEHVFEWDGVLRWQGSSPFGKARIGVSLQDILKAPAHNVTGAIRDINSILKSLIKIHRDEAYLLWYDAPQKTVFIILKEESTPKVQLKAWAVGLCVAHRLESVEAISATTGKIFEVIENALVEISGQWSTCMDQIQTAGWDVDVASLETASGKRIRLVRQD